MPYVNGYWIPDQYPSGFQPAYPPDSASTVEVKIDYGPAILYQLDELTKKLDQIIELLKQK